MKNIISIIFIIASITAIFTIGKNFNNELKDVQKEVKDYNVALTNSTQLEKTRDSLLESFNKVTQEDKKRLNNFLPNNANNIELILEIQKIASENNVILKDIKFETATLMEDGENLDTNNNLNKNQESLLPYNIFNLDFSISGSYESFLSFLKGLENNLRLINIKGISFSSIEPTTKLKDSNINKNNYKFDLKVETYWLKD